MTDLYDMMTIGKAWSDLGWAQQEQAEALVGQYGYDIDAAVEAGELNPSALYDIVRFFELAASYGCDDAEHFAGEIRTYLTAMEAGS